MRLFERFPNAVARRLYWLSFSFISPYSLLTKGGKSSYNDYLHLLLQIHVVFLCWLKRNWKWVVELLQTKPKPSR